MALIHHQLESIHPFYDGNGRTRGIINVLYLVKQGLLDIPVLYLSRHIVRTKTDYYHLSQAVRENDALSQDGFLLKQKIGRSNYYINRALNTILTREAMQGSGDKSYSSLGCKVARMSGGKRRG